MSLKSRIYFRTNRIRKLELDLEVYRSIGDRQSAEGCQKIIAEDRLALARLTNPPEGKP